MSDASSANSAPPPRLSLTNDAFDLDMTSEQWLASGARERRAEASRIYPLFLEQIRRCPFATAAVDAGEDPADAVALAQTGCHFALGERISSETIRRFRGVSADALGAAARSDRLTLLSYAQATPAPWMPRTPAAWNDWYRACAYIEGLQSLTQRSLRELIADTGGDWHVTRGRIGGSASYDGWCMLRRAFDLVVRPAALMALQRLDVDLEAIESRDWAELNIQLSRDLEPAFRDALFGDEALPQLIARVRRWNDCLGEMLAEVTDTQVTAGTPWPALKTRFICADGWSVEEITDPSRWLETTSDCAWNLAPWLNDTTRGAHLFEIASPSGARVSLLRLVIVPTRNHGPCYEIRLDDHLPARGTEDPPLAAKKAAHDLVAELNASDDSLFDLMLERHTLELDAASLTDTLRRIGFRHDDHERRALAYAWVRGFMARAAPETLEGFLSESRTGRLLAPWGRSAQAWLNGRLGTREAWNARAHELISWEQEVGDRNLLARTDQEASAAVDRLL